MFSVPPSSSPVSEIAGKFAATFKDHHRHHHETSDSRNKKPLRCFSGWNSRHLRVLNSKSGGKAATIVERHPATASAIHLMEINHLSEQFCCSLWLANRTQVGRGKAVDCPSYYYCGQDEMPASLTRFRNLCSLHLYPHHVDSSSAWDYGGLSKKGWKIVINSHINV